MHARLPETRVPAAKVCPHAFLRVNLLLGAFYPQNKVQLATSTLLELQAGCPSLEAAA
jgi:hypothetical protein